MLEVVTILGLIALPTAFVLSRRGRGFLRPLLATRPWVYVPVAVIVLSFLLLLTVGPDSLGVVTFFWAVSLIALAVYVWIREIVNVMGLSDDAFPGRNDKIIWMGLIVFLPFIGVPSFCVFRRAYWSSEKIPVDSISREMA